jgi:hypothetical protein
MERHHMLSARELAELKRAKQLLEAPSLSAKIAGTLGAPVERGLKLLPERVKSSINKAAEKAMLGALNLAVKTLGDDKKASASERTHKLAAATTGAVGGAFGILALSIELPISTTIMLRAIADIARSEGENIQHIDTKLACLEVFALGGRTKDDDAAESAYFAARAALASAVSEATKYLAQKGFSKTGAPALVQLVSAIAARFGIVVTEKAAAQLIPLLGAAGGATINTIFMSHFQDVARGHFIVRRLEKIHGIEPVQKAYAKIKLK